MRPHFASQPPSGAPPRASHFSSHGCFPSAGFQWSGCSDNLSYGIAFSQAFVDNPERSRGISSSRALMNLHNNEAGRKVRAGTRAGTQAQLLGLSPWLGRACSSPLSRVAVWGSHKLTEQVCVLLPCYALPCLASSFLPFPSHPSG